MRQEMAPLTTSSLGCRSFPPAEVRFVRILLGGERTSDDFSPHMDGGGSLGAAICRRLAAPEPGKTTIPLDRMPETFASMSRGAPGWRIFKESEASIRPGGLAFLDDGLLAAETAS